jgi:hypothetical protein
MGHNILQVHEYRGFYENFKILAFMLLKVKFIAEILRNG